MKKIAVILCGSGYRDGSEIRESVAALWALSQVGLEAECFAPDLPQADVVNCLTGEVSKGDSRQMLVEAARIARGKVRKLDLLLPSEFSGIILPGGFGAAKNLCDFASRGSQGKVLPLLQQKLHEFHKTRKPIGAICIAPALIALAFKDAGFDLTVGMAGEASAEIERLGHKHTVKKPDECLVDLAHRVVTTPAYMYDDALLHHVFSGIQKLVSEVAQLA